MTKPDAKTNYYRSILAQVNCLDGCFRQKSFLKEIYEEMTELAFYMMEGDNKKVIKGVNQIKASIVELETHSFGECYRDEQTKLIIAEIKTHLDYLLIECKKGQNCPSCAS